MAVRFPKYLQRAEKLSTKEGWRWERRGSGHVMVFDAEGNAVTNVSVTAYNGPLQKKVLSQLRKAGCPGVQ